jgi:hypothetical protein
MLEIKTGDERDDAGGEYGWGTNREEKSGS